MSAEQEMPLPSQPLFTPYRWSWHYFQLGLRDYLRERMDGKAPVSAAAPTPTYYARQLVMLLTVIVMVGVAAGALLPFVSSALGSAGVPLLTLIGGALVATAAAGLLIGLPVYLTWRLYRFAHLMACRGWMIEQRARVAIRTSIV